MLLQAFNALFYSFYLFLILFLMLLHCRDEMGVELAAVDLHAEERLP
jgi:hypothetical protein